MNGTDAYVDPNRLAPVSSYAFVFVCQQGGLEIQSVLLAASLKRMLRCQYDMIAVVPLPTDVMGTPRDVTLGLLEKLGARVVYVHNDLVADEATGPGKTGIAGHRWNLTTNKIYAIAVDTAADKVVWVDSDTILVREFCGHICFSVPFNGKLVVPHGGGGTGELFGRWQQIYDAVGVKMPNLRVTRSWPANPSRDSGFSVMPPSFSGNLFGVAAEYASELSETWLECYRTARDRYQIETDQATLAIAVHKMGLPYGFLDLDMPKHPFRHCRDGTRLRNRERLRSLAESLVEEHPEIQEVIGEDPGYQFLCGPA